MTPHADLSPRFPRRRWLAAALLLPLALPPRPAFALRGAGLEENAAKKAVVNALTDSPAAPAAGLEEEFLLPPVRPGFLVSSSTHKPDASTAMFYALIREHPEHFYNRRVLLLGAGSGVLAIELARVGATVVAVDVSDDAIDDAQHNLSLESAELRRRVTLGVSDWYNALPKITQESHPMFDVVICNNPIELSDFDPRNLLERASKAGQDGQVVRRAVDGLPGVLRPQGRAYFLGAFEDAMLITWEHLRQFAPSGWNVKPTRYKLRAGNIGTDFYLFRIAPVTVTDTAEIISNALPSTLVMAPARLYAGRHAPAAGLEEAAAFTAMPSPRTAVLHSTLGPVEVSVHPDVPTRDQAQQRFQTDPHLQGLWNGTTTPVWGQTLTPAHLVIIERMTVWPGDPALEGVGPEEHARLRARWVAVARRHDELLREAILNASGIAESSKTALRPLIPAGAYYDDQVPLPDSQPVIEAIRRDAASSGIPAEQVPLARDALAVYRLMMLATFQTQAYFFDRGTGTDGGIILGPFLPVRSLLEEISEETKTQARSWHDERFFWQARATARLELYRGHVATCLDHYKDALVDAPHEHIQPRRRSIEEELDFLVANGVPGAAAVRTQLQASNPLSSAAGLEEPVREFKSVDEFVTMLGRRKIPLSVHQRQVVEDRQSQAGGVLDVPTPVPPSVKSAWTVVETVLHPDGATTGPDERKFWLTVDRWTQDAANARAGLRFESITPAQLGRLARYGDEPLVVEIGVKDRPVIGNIPMLQINDIESLDALTFAQVYAVARHRVLLQARSWPPVVAVLNYTDERGRPRTAFFL